MNEQNFIASREQADEDIYQMQNKGIKCEILNMYDDLNNQNRSKTRNDN